MIQTIAQIRQEEKAELEIDSPFKPVTNYLNNIRKTNKNRGFR